ncbi:MAG: 2-succinyl-5-enolpyruvyl-6-hydroxy-3-cyclohexene-1-carboxylic-acid synthase [Microscillaceae bacterium]|jgi:2-succinyl-5-enolpyruvyl-6-hydroxy-3-cyclohexene-1-carboxylate synthase|nr:2-succinyl-5-enolpyruvyl-6-hydroxy-3-cyclohexene-1-carboxylic-acid synthase [Microscillaceae bacterium]
MLLQPILNIAEICARQGLRRVVLSPGSRVAHLAIAMVRHPQIETFTITDERSAAFVALGMANQLIQTAILHAESPTWVALACTSGTAVYNYAPAVAEAFYQQIPLLILTADRPPEWIDQQDGQAIHQRDIFGKHCKASFELPADYTHPDAVWHIQRLVNEAINLMKTAPYGPVHINVPIREPFYPEPTEEVSYDKKVKIIQIIDNQAIIPKPIWNELLADWEDADQKLIVLGQDYAQPELLKALQMLYQDFRVPIVGDVIANAHTLPELIRFHDIFLMSSDPAMKQKLQPDLLITCGKSLISKNLKIFLRNHKPRQHWHIQAAGTPADTFQTLTHHIRTEPTYFFGQLYADLDFQTMLERDEEGEENDYNQRWQSLNQKGAKLIYQFKPDDKSLIFNELHIVGELMQALPNDSILHLANSMSVRYANFFGLHQVTNIQVFANRGTSGIDGSTATAVGAAMLESDKIVSLLTGDLAFFYDRNGLWHNYLPANLRIILLNNQSGNIFRMIEGPSRQPELAEYFETYHSLNAQNTAQDFNLQYHIAENLAELSVCLRDFFAPATQAKILEIKTDKKVNAEVFNLLKTEAKKISE